MRWPLILFRLCEHTKITDIVGRVLRHINSNIAVRHLPENPSDIFDGLAQAVADMVDCLCDQADLILSVIERSELPVCGQLQIAKALDRVLHNHELPAFHKQNQQGHKDDDCTDTCTQNAHGSADYLHLRIDFRSAVVNHKHPVAVF